MPDVSVLLAGILKPASPSATVLTVAAEGTVVISEHIQDMASRVLRWQTPAVAGEFGDGLLRLAARQNLERCASSDPAVLGDSGSHLSAEDRQVLADAIGAKVNFLYTHDAAFFRGNFPNLKIIAPATHAWDPFAPGWISGHPTHWTFVGWFVPNWGSEIVKDSNELFYVFEITQYARCYYESRRSAFRLQWLTDGSWSQGLTLPRTVNIREQCFVAVTVDRTFVLLFVDGETRHATATLAPTPSRALFHPFMNWESRHQINGGCQFRLADCALTEAALRRHWRARAVCLTDGEIRFNDLVREYSRLHL